MTSVLTGDIINSRLADATSWLSGLKSVLNRYGNEPGQWEIFRGDSIQLELSPELALDAAILLKGTIKTVKSLDIRIAIGIGEKSYNAHKITESNGSAFFHSGECFENLKKQTLAIKTPWEEFDEKMNTMFSLVSLVIDAWTPKAAQYFKMALENPDANQKMLATMIGVEQSNISRGLSRAGFDEINKMREYYIKHIKLLCYRS